MVVSKISCKTVVTTEKVLQVTGWSILTAPQSSSTSPLTTVLQCSFCLSQSCCKTNCPHNFSLPQPCVGVFLSFVQVFFMLLPHSLLVRFSVFSYLYIPPLPPRPQPNVSQGVQVALTGTCQVLLNPSHALLQGAKRRRNPGLGSLKHLYTQKVDSDHSRVLNIVTLRGMVVSVRVRGLGRERVAERTNRSSWLQLGFLM